MEINNQIKANQDISNHLGNQMKEIEGKIEKFKLPIKYGCADFYFCEYCNKYFLYEGECEICHRKTKVHRFDLEKSKRELIKLRPQLKLLKQFQNQMKEIQGELNDKEMIKHYNLSIKIAKDKKERLMWRHRKEGWELAMEEIDEIFKNKFGDEDGNK